MNAKKKNEDILEKTGMTVGILPSSYIQDHPQKIKLRLKQCNEAALGNQVAFDVEYLEPEIRSLPNKRKAQQDETKGALMVRISDHPENHRLVTLLKEIMEDCSDFCFYGRQYMGIFFVRYFQPAKENVLGSLSAYQYLLERTEIDFEPPEEIDWNPEYPRSQDSIHVMYKMFEDQYPEVIRQWIVETKSMPLQFLRMDWRPPVLELPSPQEAKEFLDRTVYGMEAVKEQLLIYLETVRRSGSFQRNLLLAGPPGTGKTTVAQAMAALMKLPLSVVPMANVDDVETFCGFGKTYSGSQEGLLTTAIMAPKRHRNDGSTEVVYQSAQVLFLNELDKVAENGNRSAGVMSALLRMLDDNRSFFDVYHQLEIPLDNMLIIADVNDKRKLSNPLLDRFHVIDVPGYSAQEKKTIFQKFTFPKTLRGICIDPGEVGVSDEAQELIAAQCKAPGVRDLKHVAEQIAGDYLCHHAGGGDTVVYTSSMVEKFLPKVDCRQINLPSVPGSIRSLVLCEEKVIGVQIQCSVKPAAKPGFRLYGSANALLAQEMEAAAALACSFLPSGAYDIAIQLIGLSKDDLGVGQLSFGGLMAILSAWYQTEIRTTFYGGITLLGGLVCFACSSPDKILAYADEAGIGSVYTATGFADRLQQKHRCKAVELLSVNVAYELFFGSSQFGKQQAG